MMILQIAIIAVILIVLFVLIMNGVYGVNDENLLDVTNPNGPGGVGYAYEEVYVTLAGPEDELARLFKARTICFVVLIFSEVWVALESRSVRTSIVKLPFNLALILFILFVLGILAVLTMYDLAQAYLNMVPLTSTDWAIAFGCSLPVIIGTEIFKMTQRAKK